MLSVISLLQKFSDNHIAKLHKTRILSLALVVLVWYFSGKSCSMFSSRPRKFQCGIPSQTIPLPVLP